MKQRYYLDKLRAPIVRRLRSGQWVTYVVCLAVAAVCWYINKLDNTYSQEVNLRVKYIDFPEDQVVMQEPVSTFKVGLRASGLVLFPHVVGVHFEPFLLNVSELDLSMLPHDESVHYVTTQHLRSLIGEYYGTECEIAYVTPDTIWFRFDALSARMMPVKPVLRVETEDGLQVDTAAVAAFPAEVEVRGAAGVLDTMAQVETLPVERKRVREALHAEVRLAPAASPFVHFKQQKIKVTVPVKPLVDAAADTLTAPAPVLPVVQVTLP